MKRIYIYRSVHLYMFVFASTCIYIYIYIYNRHTYIYAAQSARECRIHRFHCYRGVRPSNEYPIYDSKLSDGEVPVLELSGMWSTLSLPLVPGSLWPSVISPDSVLFIGKKNCLTFKQCANKWLILINWIVRYRIVWSFNCM